MADIDKSKIVSSMEEAAERMGLEIDDLKEMINEVLEDCNEKAKKLKDLIAAGDVDQVKAIAHDIKGSSANYGLDDQSEIAKKIEIGYADLPADLAAELHEHFEKLLTFGLNQ